MNNILKGGLEPIGPIPTFKYTFNEDRKLFIGAIYSYAPYLIACITGIPFDSYSYKDDIYSSNNNKPTYSFLGGVVYEILNKKFTNIDLYDYCDPTSDIDVSLYPPKLEMNSYDVSDEDEVCPTNFLGKDGRITPFYSDFTYWVFENMVKNIKSIQIPFNKVPNVVDFDIDEYNDIPNGNKGTKKGTKKIRKNIKKRKN
jgi:hypothetical protein